MTAIVLVHGAYHGPPHFQKLVTCLKKSGFETEAVALPSVDVDHDPKDALTRDATAIREAVEKLTGRGKSVALLMHSYGGICGSEAAASFLEHHKTSSTPNAGTITRLIYLNAYLLDKGSNWQTEHTADKDPNLPTMSADISVNAEGVATFNKPIEWYYTPTTDPVEASAAAKLIRPMAVSAFLQPTKHGGYGWAGYGEGEKGVPVTYIGCKLDRALPLAMQEDFVARLRNEGVSVSVTWLQYDHSPYLTYAEEVAQIVGVAVEKSE